MKKIFAIVLTFAMLSLFVGVSALSNSTAQIATINFPVKTGEKIRFSVVISEHQNSYASITIANLEYDKNLLKFEGFESSEKNFVGSISSSNSTEFTLISSPTNQASANMAKGGECCVLVFTAKTVISKNTKISAKIFANVYANGKNDNWTEYIPLSVAVISGGISISQKDFDDNINENPFVNPSISEDEITPSDTIVPGGPLGDESKIIAAGIIGLCALLTGAFFVRKYA